MEIERIGFKHSRLKSKSYWLTIPLFFLHTIHLDPSGIQPHGYQLSAWLILTIWTTYIWHSFCLTAHLRWILPPRINCFAEITPLDMSLCQIQIKPEVLSKQLWLWMWKVTTGLHSSYAKELHHISQNPTTLLSWEPYSLVRIDSTKIELAQYGKCLDNHSGTTSKHLWQKIQMHHAVASKQQAVEVVADYSIQLGFSTCFWCSALWAYLEKWERKNRDVGNLFKHFFLSTGYNVEAEQLNTLCQLCSNSNWTDECTYSSSY